MCSSLAVFACNSPARPSVTVVAGRPTSPAQNATFSYYSQPITLVVTPGVAATGAPPTTVLEVATDSAFASIVVTKTLPPAVNSQSTAMLDHLNAATTYYWRVKTTAGDNPSIVSATSTFTIGPQLVIQAPTPVTPLADSFPHKRPTFTVANAARTGPAATLTYRFEIASDEGFNALVGTATVAETPDQTSFTLTSDLASGATFYWRAQASDTTKGVIGPYSPAQAFTTVNPDDGTFPYRLVVSVVPCAFFDGIAMNPSLQSDGMLTVSGSDLGFLVPNRGAIPNPGIHVNLQRHANQVSGTIGGSVAIGIHITDLELTGVFSGTNTVNGLLSGIFTGHVYWGTIGLAWANCDVANPWTLTPH